MRVGTRSGRCRKNDRRETIVQRHGCWLLRQLSISDADHQDELPATPGVGAIPAPLGGADVSIASMIAWCGELELLRSPVPDAGGRGPCAAAPEFASAKSGLAAEAGIAVDSTLATATAAANGNIKAEQAGHRRGLPVPVRDADCGELRLTRTMWQLSETDANDRLGSAAAATATHNARPCNGLLAGARGFRRRPCPPRFLTIGLTARLLAPRPCVFLIFILARGVAGAFAFSWRRRSRPSAFRRSCIRAGRQGGMLGKFRDRLRRHADIVGRRTFHRHIAGERRVGHEFSGRRPCR